MEGARGDEEDMVGLDRPVFRRDGRAFDQRQQVALHALAADVRPAHVGPGADLVDLVDEDDAVLLHRLERGGLHHLVVQKLVGLLVHQDVVAFGHGHLPALGAPAEGLPEDLAEVHHPHLALPGGVEHLHRVRRIGDVDLDHRAVELAALQLAAEHLAGLLARIAPGDGFDHAVLGGLRRAGLHILAHPGAGLDDGRIHQIADDAVHVAADIAHLGELRGLDLQEGRLGQPGQTARDLGLPDAGRADHQDVLGIDFVAQVVGQLLPPPAVAERHRHGALRLLLADDEAVELRDDLARGQVGHFEIRSTVRLPFV